ncbi:MAG: biopolymer transporter ExbD [Candidatus Zixiibacteriota bacterium]|nr:MAG: biopolymer transporter ExbD [candidate division Zixibacteria bacterium]
MAIKKKRRVNIRIDMTPMVDITFLLLIFYMTTTQFKPPEARAVTLPESHSQIELPDKDVINVTVTKDDSIYVDLIQKVTVNMDGKMVETKARVVKKADIYSVAADINRARAKNLKALVVLKGDRDAPFGTVQKIMKSMQENGLTRFLVITENEVDEEKT